MPSLRDIYKKPGTTVSDIVTTKGDILIRGETAPTRLPVGSDNQVLVADSSEATGLKWAFVDTGFAVVNTSFTTPLVGETVIITVSNNKWMYAGMYVYIQDAGVYYVVSKSGTTLVTVRNEYDVSQGNSASGTTIGIARGIVPAGRRGSDGNNSYSTVTSSFTIPAALDTSTLNLGATSWISEGQILYLFGAGYYEVITKIDSTTLTVKNLGYEGNLVTGTVDTGTLVTTSGIKGLDGVNAYTYTSVQFTQPITGQNVVITVEDSRWMSVGQHIYIEGGGAYVVIDVISLISIEIQNLGSPENVSSGTLVATAAKVSPSGLTGVAGSNALVTTLDVAGFIQPAVNGTVQVTVGSTEFLAAGSYVYIPGGGFYKVISIDSISQLTIENIGGSTDNAAESSSIAGNVLIVPSAKPGVDGVDGVDGSNGLDGQDGQGIDHISLTSTTGPIDTYTIWGDLAETINLGTFEIVDGIDGINGVDGTDGVDGQGIDHISLTNTTGSVDTYTVWGDVGETINLGTFTITNGSVSAASSLSLDHQVTDPAQIVDKLILYSKADGLYYRQPDGNVSLVLIDTDIGTDIGNIVELENVGGVAGLPAVDGSQLLNLPAGGHTIQDEGIDLTQQSKLNFTGDLVNVSDNVDATDVTVNSGLTNLGDILYHDGSGLNTLPKGTAGQVLTSDDVAGLAWTDAGTGGGGTFNSPTTTKGDLIVRGDTVDTRLAVGAENTFLSPDPSSPTGLTWKNPVLGGAMLFDNAIESVQVITPELADNESAIVYADISRTYLLTKIEEIYGKQVNVEVLSNDLGQDVPDPNVVLMLNANGNNGDTSTIDSSLSNHTVSFNGNAQISTVQSKFGGSSFYFDGVNSYIRCDSALADINLVSTSFTIELWIYPLSVANSQYYLGINKLSTGANILVVGTGTNQSVNNIVMFYEQNTTIPFIGSNNILINQWNHIAICYDSNSYRLYLNGVAEIEEVGYTFATPLSECSFIIGAEADSSNGGSLGNWVNCYIDDIRITKGVARYTSNFTPPTSELTASITEQGKTIASYTNFTTQETSLLGYIDQPSLGNKVPLRVINRSGADTTLTLNLDVIKTSTTNLNLAKGLDNPPKYYTVVTGTLAAGASEVVSVDFPRVYILSDLRANVNSQLSVFSRYTDNSINNLLQTYNLTANQTLETNLLGFNEDPTDSQVKLQITNNSATAQAITVEAELVEMQPATPNYKFDNAPTEVTVTTGILAADASEIVSLPYPRVCVLSDLTADVDCDVEFYSRYDDINLILAPDPKVVLMLNANGSNGDTSTTDSSLSNHTITFNGNAQISTTQSKFGGGSFYFDGTGDYLSIENNPNLSMEAGDWTIEFWINFSNLGDYILICKEDRSNSINREFFVRFKNNNLLELGLYPNDTFISGSFIPNLNSWYFISIVRSSNSISIYVNGITIATGTYTGSLNLTTQELLIGSSKQNGVYDRYFNGHIDDLRITKGVARYTSNFTPPTSELSALIDIADYSLLQSYTLTANTLLETNLLTFNEDPSDSYLKAKITNTSASPAAITLTTEIIPVFSPTGMTWRLATTSQEAQPEVGYFFDTDQPVTLTLPTSPAIGTTVYCGLLQVTNLTVTGGVINGVGDVSITTVGQLHRFIYTNPTYGWFYEVLNSTGGGALTIKNEGIDLAQRSALNFTGELVTVSDNSGADSTDIAINLPTTINLGTWTS